MGILACFFLSGMSSLMYQVTWIRKLVLIFGSTTFAVSTVLTVFMGGLALGSYLAGRLGQRIRRGPTAYGLMEILIGAYGFLVAPIFSTLTVLYQGIWDVFHPSFYNLSLIRFALTSLVLLIPTTLMGATLPVLSKYYAAHMERVGLKVGRLYAINTFGAVVGTFLAGFILLPAIGISRTILVAGVVNFILGSAIILLSRGYRAPAPAVQAAPTLAAVPQPVGRRPDGLDPGARPEPAVGAGGPGDGGVPGMVPVAGRPPLPQDVALPAILRMMLLTFALSGFAAMIFEVAWTRALSLILGSTTYAFSSMLTTFLIGLALGSFVISRRSDRLRDPVATLAFLLIIAGASTYGGLYAFNLLPVIFVRVFEVVRVEPFFVTLAQFLLCFPIMIIPTFALGGVFPLIVKIYSAKAEEIGHVVGNVYSANTVGAILGSLSAGFLLVPLVGAKQTILVGVAIEVLLGLLLLGFFSLWRGTARFTAAGGALVGASVVAAWLAPSWSNDAVMAFDTLGRPDFVKANYALADEIIYYKDGASATVAVGKRGRSIFLAVNGRINASDRGDMPTQVMLAQFPLLVAPKLDRVIIIGWGSGVTVGSAAQYPPSLLKSIKAVELEYAVVEGSRYFEHVNNRPLLDPRVEMIVDDGRNYLQLGRQRYDVIISEPSHPWMTGVSNLFTRDFFEIVKSRLNEDGVFGQWLQTYQMSPPNLKSLIRTFREVFPHTLAFVTAADSSDLILLGSRKPLYVDLQRLEERMNIPRIKRDLEGVDIHEVDDVLGLLRMGTREMLLYGVGAPLNTDDNALIEFAAPRDMYIYSADQNMDEINALGQDLDRYVIEDGALPVPPPPAGAQGIRG